MMPLPLALYLVLLVVFFTSGLCALAYQVAWTRLLDHVFGISVFATTTVLATFMSGLALGAWAAGRAAERTRRPLASYAVIEFGIAATAFLVPSLLAALEPVYGLFFRTLGDAPVLLTTARALLAFAALIIPASLMGATFPFMTASLVKTRATAGRDLGLIYGINTLGGVAGALAAGFFLLPWLGTSRTIYLAGGMNLVAAGAAYLLSRESDASAGERSAAAPLALDPTVAPLAPVTAALLVALVFASGFTSLAYEVIWFRGMLAYVYNSTYAFSLMLATFLLGIAIGGTAYGLLPSSSRRSAAFVGWLTALVGLSFWGSTLIFPHLNQVAYSLLDLRLVDSWTRGLSLIAVECALVLLLPATLLGMTFPASLHLLAVTAPGFATRIGRLYSLNTAGGILGSLVAGFVLIPTIGMRNALLALIATQIAIGAGLVMSASHGAVRFAPVLAVAGILLVIPVPTTTIFVDSLNQFPHANRIIFYSEGITDSTAVTENIKTGARVVVYSDGRGTAGTDFAGTQKFLGHVPMLLHPDPRRVLNVGFGVGNSMSAIIKHDPEVLDCVELSPQVRETARFFWTNDGVLNDPRVRLIAEDGATFLRYTDQRYDVISLEPPELHVAGVVNLYTADFYRAARRAMNPGGILEHWFTASQIPEAELKMLLRTFLAAFPYSVAFTELESTTYLMLGSDRPIEVDLALLRERIADPRLASHLANLGIDSPEAFLAFYVADRESLLAYVGEEGPLVTQDRTWVDFAIPRSGEAGFGFGPFKHPKSREAFHRRIAEDWAVIDGLKRESAASSVLRLTPEDDAGAIDAQVETRRAHWRALRPPPPES